MLLTMASATKNTMTPAVSLLRSMTTLERFLCEQLVGCVICVSRGRRVSDQTDNNTLQQNTHARTCANEQHNDRSTQTLGGRGLTKAAQRTASGEKKTASVQPKHNKPDLRRRAHAVRGATGRSLAQRARTASLCFLDARATTAFSNTHDNERKRNKARKKNQLEFVVSKQMKQLKIKLIRIVLRR